MPEGPDGKTIIIVKKVSGHGGHHGGSWKVAYADFVTSMMAFFLVMWLVNSASVSTRERIASYFRRPGIFEMGSGSPVEIGGAGILPDSYAPSAEKSSVTELKKRIYEGSEEGVVVDDEDDDLEDGEARGATRYQGAGGDAGSIEAAQREKESFEKIASELMNAIESSGGAELLGKVSLTLDRTGLHLEIMDTPKASMFSLGSAKILEPARAQLKAITSIIKVLPNPIDIEGHTDAKPFKSDRTQYDNWDLSTDRANQARRVLLESGLQVKQIARVVGYADQRLKFPDRPLDASNRRITISMRFTHQAAIKLDGTYTALTTPVPISEQWNAVGSPADDRGAEQSFKSEQNSSTASVRQALSEEVVRSNSTGALHLELSHPEPGSDEASEAPRFLKQKEAPSSLIFDDKNKFFD